MADGSETPERVAGLLEESAEDLYENAPCGYVSALLDGTIVKVNQTFLDWTGFARAELVGVRRLQDLLTAGGRIFHETHYAPLLRMQGAVREIAVDFVCADGRRLPALINSVVREATGGHAVVRTTVFDASDRREYERELLRALQRAEESEARARELAQTLQASLIPPGLPSVEGLDVGSSFRPAGRGDQVGGDFYDVFELTRGQWAVVLGDVRGKGVEAATVTALARYTVRAAAIQTLHPRFVLRMLNDALLRHDTERFCTVVYARARIRSGRTTLSLASGGHPLPVRITRAGEAGPIGNPGTLLGMFEDPELHDATVDLLPEDVVVFYTDGVIEARRGTEFFGEQRLHSLLVEHRHEDASALAGILMEEVVTFQEGAPRDDVAVVVLKVPPPA